MTDYKKYSLEQVENFLYDAMSTDATAEEIYDVIKGVVEDNLNVYITSANKAQQFLSLLNGGGHIPPKAKIVIPSNTCDKDDPSLECKKPWSDFWKEPSMPPWGHSDLEYGLHYTDEEIDAMCTAAEEKKKTWTVPVEEDDLGEYVIKFPDELIQKVGWQEDDTLEWIDNKDGSFSIKKVIN
jgi:hypothetical protein